VTFQYAHFEFYTPFVNYPARDMDPSPFEYLDYAVAGAYLKGIPAEEVAKEEPAPLRQSVVREIGEWALDELRKREVGDTGQVDITLTEFIAQRFRDTCLFHTINHPAGPVFQYLTDAVVERLAGTGVSLASERQGKSEIHDPLGNTHFFPTPASQVAEDVVSTVPLRYHGKTISRKKYVARTYRYLEKQPAEKLRGAAVALLETRPWFHHVIDP
jgi:hypothetical protein